MLGPQNVVPTPMDGRGAAELVRESGITEARRQLQQRIRDSVEPPPHWAYAILIAINDIEARRRQRIRELARWLPPNLATPTRR
jgi:hypothetical protein